MRESWELLTAGPPDADRSVLLLPGGANAARSFNLVMADPGLSGVRLVATTLPGMAGAPVSEDVSIPALSRRAGELAKEHGCDVVVGFSHGATVALDMVLSGHFQGPVVLLGISLTTEDEAAFFRGVVRASQKVGSWPMAALLRLMPLMARSAKTPDAAQEGTDRGLQAEQSQRFGSGVRRVPRLHRRRPGLCRRAGRVWQSRVGGPRREGGRRPHRRRARHPPSGAQRDPGDDSRLGVPSPGRGSAGDRRSDRKRSIAGVLTGDALSSSAVDRRRHDV